MPKKRAKKDVSDDQFKHQQIFVLRGMQSNIKKIHKMFPDNYHLFYEAMTALHPVCEHIKNFPAEKIVRNPK